MTPEQGKLLLSVFANTIKDETKITTKVLRAVPEDKKSYKPEPKARTAHELAWHLATAEIWFLDGVLNGQFAMDEGPAAPPTIAAIVEWYETNHRERVEKLNSLAADKLVKPIPFFGLMELPAVTYLSFLNLHTAHHRGQLSTYLRPMGAKVPDIYGGSADEPFQAPAKA
jgi:uncharacterized damage-inducible protein DinB